MRALLAVIFVVVSACGVTPPVNTGGGSVTGGGAGVSGGGSGTTGGGAADCNAGASASVDVALTERGPVRGVVSDAGTVSFLGIPYVKPPTGELRWRPPEEDATCWPGVREATQWAPKCPQIEQEQGSAFDAGAPVIGEEDCLTVNVFTPQANDGGLPVMLFIHGGGNTGGSAAEDVGTTGVKLYDGTDLAARGGVVVVTFQYRIGALGFLTLSQLADETDAGISGNYGLMDQQAALRWVQRNIHHFGGDPSNVTLFGESAGGLDTCMQLAAPGSAGLFHRAIMESGSCIALTAQQKRAEGATWLASTSCTDTACLRAMTPEQLIRAYPVAVNIGQKRSAVSWNPNVDGVVLPTNPLEALQAGTSHAVPFIVGTNADETNLAMPAVSTEQQYEAYLVAQLGQTIADQVVAKYPVATYDTPRAALVQVTTDAFFGCQARMASRAAVLGHANVPAYRYLFSRALVPARGAFHGEELPYVFQRLSRLSTSIPADDLSVEASMLQLWTSFAKTGAPMSTGLAWPQVSHVEPTQQLDVSLSTLSGWRNDECDLWDALGGINIPAPP